MWLKQRITTHFLWMDELKIRGFRYCESLEPVPFPAPPSPHTQILNYSKIISHNYASNITR